ncbi:TetR family transcriptional regulator [Kocuria rhizophila]|nr:TetR family transcriptional regulator [Kocuria rhizophila]
MDEIAAAAGVSKPVLYQHFPGEAGAAASPSWSTRSRISRSASATPWPPRTPTARRCAT